MLLVIVFIIIFIGVYIFANLSPKGKHVSLVPPIGDNDSISISDNTESQSLLHDKEDPSLTDNKEDPSLTDNKEDPSLTDNKESLSLTVLTDDKKAPFLTDDKEPPSLANDKEPPSLAKDKEPPSLANDKEPPSLAKDKEPPSLANDKETQLLPKYDIMPLAKYLKSREEFQNTEWVSVLYNYLKHLESPHVNMVFGDSKHMRLLENWITASMMTLKPPLDNVMVLSLDHLLCDQLMSTKFDVACIAAPIESFIVAYPEEVDKKWCAAMMVRQVVLRLINYWGYDVASYDSDAVLLRNPQVLYDAKPHVDVFSGSTKNFPGMVSKKWGFNLSCGVLILRATPAVGMCITGDVLMLIIT